MYCCPGVFQFIFKKIQALTEKGMQKEMQYPAVLQWRASAQKKTKIMAEKITPVYTPLLAVQIIANATSWELMSRSICK